MGANNSVEGLEFFSLAVLEAVMDSVAVIKPQVAFFERFGSQGFRVLERLMSDARDANVLIVADAKRGDVDSTNVGYAQAWLEEASPLRCDAVTASPYLGVESLAPLFERAASTGRGVFVLAATSNEEGREVQSARTKENETVEDFVLGCLRARNAPLSTWGLLAWSWRRARSSDVRFDNIGWSLLGAGCGLPGRQRRKCCTFI